MASSQTTSGGGGVVLPPLTGGRAHSLPYAGVAAVAATTPRSATPSAGTTTTSTTTTTTSALKAVPMTASLSAESTASTASSSSTSSIPAVVPQPPAAVTPVPVPLLPTATPTATPTAAPRPAVFKAKRNAKPGTAPMLSSTHRLYSMSPRASPGAAVAATAATTSRLAATTPTTAATTTTTTTTTASRDRGATPATSTPRRETPVRPPSVPGAANGTKQTGDAHSNSSSTMTAPAPRPPKRDHSAISTDGPPASTPSSTTTTTGSKLGRPRKIPRLFTATNRQDGPGRVAATENDDDDDDDDPALRRFLDRYRVPTAAGADSDSDSDSDTDRDESVDRGSRAGSRASGSSAWDEAATESADSDEEDGDGDGDGPQALWIAPSGRPYNKWRDDKGELHGTAGALLPDGYRQDSGDAAGAWPCPVRACGNTFPSLTSLGHHFSRGHRAQLFHDERDGTFSIAGEADDPSARQGARVVSQSARAAKTTRAASTARPPAPSPSPAFAPNADIRIALDGRPYARSPFGGSSFGTIMPAKYELCSYPQHPWVCPVRTCRRVFVAPNNLGAHFTRQHRRAQFNDNGDGTLSQVGDQGPPVPVVVSQHVRPAAALEPLATPGLPVYQNKNAAKQVADWGSTSSAAASPAPAARHGGKGSLSVAASPATPRPSAVKSDLASARLFPSVVDPMTVPDAGDLADPVPADAKALWAYIAPLLRRTDRRAPPMRACVRQFLMLPRRRAIAWNEAWVAANPFVDAVPRDVASLVVQLTGDHVAAPCASCRRGRGPYAGCVIVSKDAPCELNAAFACCANCLYHNKQTQCDLRDALAARFRRLFPGVSLARVRKYLQSGALNRVASLTDGALRFSAQLRAGEAEGEEDDDDEEADVDVDEEVDDADEAEDELQDTTSYDTKADTKPDDDAGARRSHRLSAKATPDGPRLRREPATTTTTTMTTTTTTKARAAEPARAPPPRMLEMEDWEVAPGRIQAGGENIAFSNAYLTSTQLVPLDGAMGFQVLVVRPGATVAFAADARAWRVCSLAAGKLRVRVDGAAAFAMGPHGMFRARPGTGFAVENRAYEDAYVHMTVVRT